MITATADQISAIIVGNPVLLRELHAFLGAADIDDDLGAILDELPAAIAAHSPFADEAAMTEAIKRETLQALRALALRRLPAKGTA